MVQRRQPLQTLLVCACLLAAPPAQGASGLEATSLAAVRHELARVDQLLAAVDSVHPRDRDGLNTRIDQLGIQAIRSLNVIAGDLLGAPDLAPAVRAELVELLDRSAALAWQREVTLEQRAARERETLPKFEQSAQADIARAFIEDLARMRKDYIEATIRQAAIRQAAGLDAEALFERSRERVTLIMERLTGQIRLDAMSLEEMRARLADQPLDEQLQEAVVLVQLKQTRNLNSLERVIEIAAQLGITTSEQSSLLIRERGQIGVELLEREVFRTLWNDQFRGLREGLARKGPDALFRMLLFLALLLLAWIAARLVRIPVRALVQRENFRLSFLLRDALVSFSSVMVFVAGLFAALAAMGVSLAHVFAGLGVLGILVGLAIQDTLGDLAAGVMILLHRPFDLDDHIKVAGADGNVRRMNLVATTVATFDNQLLVVPNRRIWGDTIVNFTASRVRRVDIKVGFSYSEDPDHVQSVLMDVLRQHELVLESPEPQVNMVGMEDSSLTMVAKPWVRTEHYWIALWDLTRLIKKRFDAEGIEIPFPQRVVTMRSADERAKGEASVAEPPPDEAGARL